jgi:hypothetical protein
MTTREIIPAGFRSFETGRRALVFLLYSLLSQSLHWPSAITHPGWLPEPAAELSNWSNLFSSS